MTLFISGVLVRYNNFYVTNSHQNSCIFFTSGLAHVTKKFVIIHGIFLAYFKLMLRKCKKGKFAPVLN
jgi:hypothetical protein